MDDPRLAELHLLADLARQEASTMLSPLTDAAKYRVSGRVLKDIVFDLLCTSRVSAGEPMGADAWSKRTPAPPENPVSRLWRVNEPAYQKLETDQSVTLHITHAGRVRLWELRDQLDKRRVRDTFGILIDGRHLDEDLLVRAWMQPDALLSAYTADLDHFKALNDKHGHAAGDDAIRVYLGRVRLIASAYGGEAYRTGGDETITILPGADREKAAKAAEALRAAVHAEFQDRYDDLPARLTTSIGVGTFKPPISPTQVRKVIDDALYNAKKAGRNKVVAANG